MCNLASKIFFVLYSNKFILVYINFTESAWLVICSPYFYCLCEFTGVETLKYAAVINTTFLFVSVSASMDSFCALPY